MALTSGTSLGPYDILMPIGAGGMGEVYKAKDTRLDRTVAIKVLPEHLAESPVRKARFQREAKAISQLNHPHICTLYDVGEQDGLDFIVMEYIEGETLAERLKKGPLPLGKALEYGIQIADGLDNAHRAGIVHRDLKPPNVMLTSSGVKLLDFGLAKLDDRELDSATSEAPTQQRDLTDEQSIVGTLQYMAPEQLERRPVDARTDLFAFGALLYEMVTGKKAFEGKSQASLIAAIINAEPLPLGEVQRSRRLHSTASWRGALPRMSIVDGKVLVTCDWSWSGLHRTGPWMRQRPRVGQNGTERGWARGCSPRVSASACSPVYSRPSAFDLRVSARRFAFRYQSGDSR